MHFCQSVFLQKPQNSTPGEKAPPHSAQTVGTKKGRCRSIRLFHTAQIVRLFLFLEPVFTRNMCGFSSIILLQTRQKYAGGLSPGKYFSRSMQQNLPKRHVYTLVKTGSYNSIIPHDRTKSKMLCQNSFQTKTAAHQKRDRFPIVKAEKICLFVIFKVWFPAQRKVLFSARPHWQDTASRR